MTELRINFVPEHIAWAIKAEQDALKALSADELLGKLNQALDETPDA